MPILNPWRRVAQTLLLALSIASLSPAHAGALTHAQAVHLLNRLGYGPAPGEVAQLRQTGVHAYVEHQLAPPGLSPALAARFGELAEAGVPVAEERLLRAIASPRQLEEVLAAFWMSHFGLADAKGSDLRPYVFGRYAALHAAAMQRAGAIDAPAADDAGRAALPALARHFVAAPSAALLRALGASWDATGGDQRAVLRVLFSSREFLTPSPRNSFKKDDFRFVVSALRASGLIVENAAPLANVLARPMGLEGRARFARQLAHGCLALAVAPPRPHRYASSAPPHGLIVQPGPVLIDAPTPSARAMAAAARSQPADADRLLKLLRSEAFQRY